MASSAAETSVPPLIRTADNDFFFVAAAAGRLEIQRCTDCGMLRHPPAPACPQCRSFAWHTIESSRRATLHSWTVVHHPRDPAFDYPMAVGLVDLAEGVRLVADIADVELGTLALDMELEVGFAAHARGEILPRLFLPGQARGVPR